MTAIDGLLASYLDVARHLDPLRHPFEAPASLQHAIGRFDAPWLHAQVVALRAIANAVEDLDEVEALEDEVDRTMLIDMIRADALRLEASVEGDVVDPVAPLGHAVAALDMLMEERFTGNEEAALRDRVAALPELLAALCNDSRAIPEHLVDLAQLELAALAEAIDEASERLDDAAVQPALAALGDCRGWLDDPVRRTAASGLSETALDGILSTLVSEPVGHRGTLRLLELRRAGVERSLAGAAEELGSDDGLAIVRALREEHVSRDDADAAWHAEWRRVGNELGELGLPVVQLDPTGPAPIGIDDEWSFTAIAVRAHAAYLFDAARANQPRAVRRLLVAPGLIAGWGRTVAALLRATPVFGTPERRAMMSHRALIECAAAEADLLLHGGHADVAALKTRVQQSAGLTDDEARRVVLGASAAPFEALAAALAHEGWQAWYAEDGGDPVEFLMLALEQGGLAVPLARWASAGARSDR